MTMSISLLLAQKPIEEVTGILTVYLTIIIKLCSLGFSCKINGLCYKAYMGFIRASMEVSGKVYWLDIEKNDIYLRWEEISKIMWS